MRRRFVLVPVLLLAATIVLAPSPARAYEHQWHIGGALGYALTIDPTYNGFGGGVHLTYGLTDAFNAMVELDLTAHPGADALVGSGSIGAGYVLDILEWVPYVGLMAGVYDFFSYGGGCGGKGEPGCIATRIGFSVPVGLDYLVSRSLAIGVAGRYHILPIGGDSTTQYLTVFARAEYIWGF